MKSRSPLFTFLTYYSPDRDGPGKYQNIVQGDARKKMRHYTGTGLLTYTDLAEFGLPLVTPGQPELNSLVHDIESRPKQFGNWSLDDLTKSAVLVHQSGDAIVAISYVWRYVTATGTPHASRYSNLGSSAQLDVLTGRAGVTRDIGT